MSDQDGEFESRLEQGPGRATGWIAPPPAASPAPQSAHPSPPTSPPPPPFGGIGSPPEVWLSTMASPASYPVLTPPVEPLPLLVILPDRLKQRRWTVLLRAFMAIPFAVVVIAIGVATAVCVVLGWFAAIVTGRVPEFVRSIVTVLLRMELRLEAYVFLLTDRFPPFSTEDDPAYGTLIAVPPATPVESLCGVLPGHLGDPGKHRACASQDSDSAVLGFFMWIVVLVTGWLPQTDLRDLSGLHPLRPSPYRLLLSSWVPTYPGELFGDLPPPPILAPVDDAPGYFAREPNKAAERPPLAALDACAEYGCEAPPAGRGRPGCGGHHRPRCLQRRSSETMRTW